MNYKADYYWLASGRRFYANGGCLGIGPQENDELSQGWDGGVSPEPELETADDGVRFTDEERREIAEEMVQRWKRWGGIEHG